MLFPTELGGGNDSRIAAICRGDLCDMACNRPRLSFPARRNDAGGGNFRNPKRGVPRVFRQFPTALPCIMEPRRETIPTKRCVGCLRRVLRRGASASMPPLRPGDMREHASFCFCTYFFRRLVCGEFQRRRLCRDGVAGGIPRCLVSYDGVAQAMPCRTSRRYRHAVSHVAPFSVTSSAMGVRNAFRASLRGIGPYRFERMRFREKKKKLNPALVGRGPYEEEKGVPL